MRKRLIGAGAAVLCLAGPAWALEWRLDLPSNLNILGRGFQQLFAGPEDEGAVITGLRADVTLDTTGSTFNPELLSFDVLGFNSGAQWVVTGLDFGWTNMQGVQTTNLRTDAFNGGPAFGFWEINTQATDFSFLGGMLIDSAIVIEYEIQAVCRADVNDDSVVDVFDLLFYLEGWFAGDADLNGDNITDVFDLLAYLEDWFAGCP